MSQWYYAKNGQQQGPVTGDVIRQAVAQGQLSATDLVWQDGMPDWRKIRDVPELASAAQVRQAEPVRAQYAPQTQYVPAQTLSYQQSHGAHGLVFTARAMDMLKQTKPWARLIAVLGFIAAGLYALGGLLIGLGAMAGGASGNSRAVGYGAGVFIGYMLTACAFFFPALYLNRYASRIGQLMTMYREDVLELAMEAQKSYWRLVGIIALVVICLVVGIMVLAIAIGGIAAMR